MFASRTPFPKKRPLFLAIALGLSTTAVAAPDPNGMPQDAEPAVEAAQDAEVKSLDRVQVTGSRIKRTDIEGPSPVITITAEDIRKQGYSTVAEALQTLTVNNGANVAGASPDNFLNLSNTQPDASFLNLRGMGVGYQLVLLNGKRMTEYAASSGAASTGVSLGSIPAAAVARIEVLNGGASAIYGSDAVAGVVNIVTRDNWEGHNVRVRAGTTERGGGDTLQLQLTGGKASDRGSLTYSIEKLNRDPIFAAQRGNVILSGMRAPGNAGTDRPTWGLDMGLMDGDYNDYYWMAPNGELVYASDVDPATARAALENSCRTSDPLFFPMYWSSSDANPGTCGNAAYYDQDTIANRQDKLSAYVAGTYRLTDSLEGYGQLLVQQSRSKSTHRTSMYLYNSGDAYDVNIGKFEYWRPLTPQGIGGAPWRTWDENFASLNLGVRGTVADRFDWDASVALSRDEMRSSWRQLLKDRVHRYLFGEAIGEVDGAPLYEIDPRVLFGPVSPEAYNQMVDTVRNRNLSQTSQAQFVFTGPLFSLPAGDVDMAAVLEASHSKYELGPDPRSVSTYDGPDKTFNFTGVSGGGPRDRYGAGLELRVPLLDSLTANFAGRWDKYDDISDVGDATTWQASLEWRPVDRLLVRASRQTSFMAPNIMWLYGEPVVEYNDYLTNYYLCRVDGMDLNTSEGLNQCRATHRQGAWYTEGGNNTRLHEETATSTGLGIVWDVTDQLSLSADYWRIELSGKSQYMDSEFLMSENANCLLGRRIDGTAVDPNSAACAIYLDYVDRDASGRVREYFLDAINQAGVRTEGFDLTLRYAIDTASLGRFNLAAGHSRTRKYEVQIAAGDPWEDYLECSYYVCGEQPVAFRSRSNWTVSWSRDAWNASLYGYRNAGRVNYRGTALLPAYVQWNGSLSRQVTDHVRVGVDVVNLFDKFGPKDETITWFPFYSMAYGAIGRSYFLNVDIDF